MKKKIAEAANIEPQTLRRIVKQLKEMLCEQAGTLDESC
jgi:hypothetical protein